MSKQKNVRYKIYQGKFVYVIYQSDGDYISYVGMTSNIRSRNRAHIYSTKSTKFAKTIPKHKRKFMYSMEVYDFSDYPEITKYDLRLIEAYLAANVSAELSKPKKLSQQDKIRLSELLPLISHVKPIPYDQFIRKRQLLHKKKLSKLSFF